jgi:hypothetical protein
MHCTMVRESFLLAAGMVYKYLSALGILIGRSVGGSHWPSECMSIRDDTPGWLG